MEQLKISLFAPLQIELHDNALADFRTQKVLALLVYLAAEPETAHRRETLMTLLWPGMPDTSARADLRQVLFHLRKAIPDFAVADSTGADEAVPLLLANRHTIQLNPDAPVAVDTAPVRRRCLSRVLNHDHNSLLTCSACREDLNAAVALYTDHFLADFYLDDSSEFEEWAEIERQKYRRKVLDALETLTAIAIRQQAYGDAQAYAEHQLELDDFREQRVSAVDGGPGAQRPAQRSAFGLRAMSPSLHCRVGDGAGHAHDGTLRADPGGRSAAGCRAGAGRARL